MAGNVARPLCPASSLPSMSSPWEGSRPGLQLHLLAGNGRATPAPQIGLLGLYCQVSRGFACPCSQERATWRIWGSLDALGFLFGKGQRASQDRGTKKPRTVGSPGRACADRVHALYFSESHLDTVASLLPTFSAICLLVRPWAFSSRARPYSSSRSIAPISKASTASTGATSATWEGSALPDVGAGRKAPPSRQPGIDALCQSEYYLVEAVPIPPVLIDRVSLRNLQALGPRICFSGNSQGLFFVLGPTHTRRLPDSSSHVYRRIISQ